MSAYLLGIRFAEEIPNIPGWDIWRFTAMGCELAIAVVTLRHLWRTRGEKRSWALFGIFGGTLVAGQVFNLYSQPHDPQMQINVMAWTTVGWAFVLLAAGKERRFDTLADAVQSALNGDTVEVRILYTAGDVDNGAGSDDYADANTSGTTAVRGRIPASAARSSSRTGSMSGLWNAYSTVSRRQKMPASSMPASRSIGCTSTPRCRGACSRRWSGRSTATGTGLISIWQIAI